MPNTWRLGITRLQLIRESRHLCQRVTQSPRLQDACHIGSDLDARTHLAQLRCALQQLHGHTLLRACNGSGEAANAAACDQHLFVLMTCHTWIVREGQTLNLSHFCSGICFNTHRNKYADFSAHSRGTKGRCNPAWTDGPEPPGC